MNKNGSKRQLNCDTLDMRATHALCPLRIVCLTITLTYAAREVKACVWYTDDEGWISHSCVSLSLQTP